MKFCKRYEEYMQGREEDLPGVGLKKLKKMLKGCRRELQSHHHLQSQFRFQPQIQEEEEENQDGVWNDGGGRDLAVSINKCSEHCPACDGTFFPSLFKEMAAVVDCFNKRAQKVLELHSASGLRKCILWFRSELRWNDGALVQEGRDLVKYSIINYIAMKKILKKYDKIHYSSLGQAFRSQAQNMHIEILQSPWVCELMAFCLNSRDGKVSKGDAPGLFGDCSLTFDGDRPVLSCGSFDSVKLDINLTCSVCLDTVFDPVSLRCGHIFCYICCCSAASVTIVDGLQAVNPTVKCPLCRREGVYEGAVHLDELDILLSRSCPEYWEERLRTERVERIRQVKEHWELQCRAIMGV